MKKSGNQKSNGKGEVALKKGNEKSKLVKALHCWQLYVLLLPALLWLAVFAYYPMYGLIIAFKDFKIREGILASPWAEPLFKHFIDFFSTSIAVNAIKNTIILSLETLVIGFPIPVIFALLLNQIQRTGLRKTIQTITYAPYFMSNVVILSIITVMFSANGVTDESWASYQSELEAAGVNDLVEIYQTAVDRAAENEAGSASSESAASTSSTSSAS